MQNVAEREIAKYEHDHSLWHKHVHNISLDPAQILKCVEMDRCKNTIDFSCRRTGKTATKELYLLKYNACNSDQELGIVAPREAQALVNLDYHLEAIRRSEILSSHLMFKSGRTQIADTYYQFQNRSKAKAYGIMSQVDGGDLTAVSIEELDDLPRDRLFSRFLLMMGATRRLGADTQSKNDPQIRLTGVFKGADTLTDLIRSEKYHILPTINVHAGVEMGILNESFISDMKDQLSPDEYIRQLLCINTSSKNLIWEKHVRRAIQVGLSANLTLTEPTPGGVYRKKGLVGMGYDHSGHGEDAKSSRYAVVFLEQIGNFTCPIFVKSWSPGTDEQIVRRDLVGFWRYFRPDYAMGDAYGIGLITNVNDDLFDQGLTQINRMSIGGGESTASHWPEWAFSPIRFEGGTKHHMATACRSIFHSGQAAMPYIEEDTFSVDPIVSDYRSYIRQLTNIRPAKTKATYATYRMVDSSIGDDLFDAHMAATWALACRGVAPVATIIQTDRVNREQLLDRLI